MISRWLQEKEKRTRFKEVFSGEEGQDVIAALANAHFVFRTSHASDPYICMARRPKNCSNGDY